MTGNIIKDCKDMPITSTGCGPAEAFVHAMKGVSGKNLHIVDYSEHALGAGDDACVIAYVQMQDATGKTIFGCAKDSDITVASIKAILCAFNRA